MPNRQIQISCVRTKLSDKQRTKLVQIKKNQQKTLFVHGNEKFWKCQLSEVCWRVFAEHLRLQMTHFIDWKVEDSLGPPGPVAAGWATHFSGPNVVSLWTIVGMWSVPGAGGDNLTILQYSTPSSPIPPPSLSVSPYACLSPAYQVLYLWTGANIQYIMIILPQAQPTQ